MRENNEMEDVGKLLTGNEIFKDYGITDKYVFSIQYLHETTGDYMKWRGDPKYRKCSNCQRSEFECFIYVNGLCVLCQIIKDKRIKKRVKDK